MTTRTIRCRWHHDPGHEWLTVEEGDFRDLGLTEADISPYSYRSNSLGLIALEGDSDAGVLLARIESTQGFEFEALPDEINQSGDSPIRLWPGFGKKRAAA